MSHHLIFEGPELAGKSWVMSQVYQYVEPKYNKSGFALDGCHWFNADIGIFGTVNGQKLIQDYLQIFETLRDSNIIVEKLHLADEIYSFMHRGVNLDYNEVEKHLKDLGFKIVVVSFTPDKELIKKRIQDRLNIYPHYSRILKDPEWYLLQRQEYLERIKNSSLPYLVVETRDLPDEKIIKEILEWIEK